MLRSLRTPTGGPSLRARAVAVLVVVGLVILTAPVIVLPVMHWLWH
jgi:hypothetical protein